MKQKKIIRQGDQALELTMRDVLDGLEELATIAGLQMANGCMEGVQVEQRRRSAHLLHFPGAASQAVRQHHSH